MYTQMMRQLVNPSKTYKDPPNPFYTKIMQCKQIIDTMEAELIGTQDERTMSNF